MPLVNREEIRRRKEKNARLAREQERQQIAEKQKSSVYRKELKPREPVAKQKTRRGEKEKQRETGNFLNKAIMIVLVLLVLVMLAVFFI